MLSRVRGPTENDSAGAIAVVPVKSNLQLLQQRDEDIAPIFREDPIRFKDAEGKSREFNQFIHADRWKMVLYRRYEGSDGDTFLQLVASREIREETVQHAVA